MNRPRETSATRCTVDIVYAPYYICNEQIDMTKGSQFSSLQYNAACGTHTCTHAYPIYSIYSSVVVGQTSVRDGKRGPSLASSQPGRGPYVEEGAERKAKWINEPAVGSPADAVAPSCTVMMYS